MVIYYDSKTGNVCRFINKLISQNKNITAININDDEYYTQAGHLITYTTGSGSVPITTEYFMQRFNHLILSVSASGNRNWGNNFAISADKLSILYNKPVILKFELSGMQFDIEQYLKLIS